MADKILKGNLGAYKGALLENMVAISFNNYDMSSYYFHTPSGSPELDFIYTNLNGEATIVECKSTNRRATSMMFVLANPKRFGQHKAIKIADNNVGIGDGYKTYPIYALEFLLKRRSDKLNS